MLLKLHLLLLFFNIIYIIEANVENCGQSIRARGAIIGGKELSLADRGLYPWAVALVHTNNDYFCGGTLVTKNKIVTAAHCILQKKTYQELLPRNFKVLLGSFDLKDPYEVGRITMPIEDIKLHPQWNPNTDRYDGDVAILTTESDIPFTNYIKPICIINPANSNFKNVISGIVVGYGIGSRHSSIAERIPKIINMPIHSNEQCFLREKELAGISSSNTFCAGHGNGTGVCLGDSGGGMYIELNGIFYLRGIISASLFNYDRTCDVDNYAIFTDLPKFSEWIQNDFFPGSKISTSIIDRPKFIKPTIPSIFDIDDFKIPDSIFSLKCLDCVTTQKPIITAFHTRTCLICDDDDDDVSILKNPIQFQQSFNFKIPDSIIIRKISHTSCSGSDCLSNSPDLFSNAFIQNKPSNQFHTRTCQTCTSGPSGRTCHTC